MVHREHGHRGVEGAVAERQMLPRRADGRCRADRALRDHRRRRLDRDDDAIARFVGPGARRRRCRTVRGVAERGVDAGFDARIGRRGAGRTTADAVVLRGAPRRVHGKRAQQRHHLDRGRRRFFALVAFLATEPVERLLAGVDGQDAEDDRHAGIERDAGDPGRALARDVLEVRGVAADDGADADDRVDVAPEVASFCATSGSSNAPGTHTTSTCRGAVLLERALRTVEQRVGDVAVEPRHGDRDAHARSRRARLRSRRVLAHGSAGPQLLVFVSRSSRWPILRCFARRYAMFSCVGTVCSGTRSTISSP